MHELLDQRRYLIPFRGSLLPQIFTDTLVIGAGTAGLRAAIEAAGHGEVIVLAKSVEGSCASAWAQGGVAAALGGDDSVEAHVADTLAAGGGLCDEPVVRAIVEDGAARIEELASWGCAFDRDEAGAFALAREGGHSGRRIARCDGDATGREIQRTLWERVGMAERARVFRDCYALDLLTAGDEGGAPCMGAITHHPKYGLQMIWARATIVATGGAGVVWRETSNPPGCVGDGIAMAHRAGASLADMAFMQFHPTTLYVAGSGRSLISEAVRGEGAHLVDRRGRRFMPEVHEQAELAPRDVVSRAIVQHLARTGETNVYLDCRPIANFNERFPHIDERLTKFDLDPATDPIPVQPAAHYLVGGVRTDGGGRTDVPGLYAVGEASCSGLHGANRLASNSLLEGLVVGRTVGAVCEEMRAEDNPWGVAPRRAPIPIVSEVSTSSRGELDLPDVRSSLRSVMWRHVGIVRSGPELEDVEDMFGFWARYTLDKIFDDPAGWETQNMLFVGASAARSARWREESRGCHTRSDFPEARDELRAHDLWRRGREGAKTEPVRAGAVSGAHGGG